MLLQDRPRICSQSDIAPRSLRLPSRDEDVTCITVQKNSIPSQCTAFAHPQSSFKEEAGYGLARLRQSSEKFFPLRSSQDELPAPFAVLHSHLWSTINELPLLRQVKGAANHGESTIDCCWLYLHGLATGEASNQFFVDFPETRLRQRLETEHPLESLFVEFDRAGVIFPLQLADFFDDTWFELFHVGPVGCFLIPTLPFARSDRAEASICPASVLFPCFVDCW